ncbi:MAG: monovalent cation/H+ antiporter complex subunit F [Andreesenia angusta]|nr:monovalent cation/H+ antiporter complex subunit F [Andreesenia angusta]
MEKILITAIIALSISIFICFIRAVKGPEFADRLIAINVIGTKTIVLISIVSFIIKESYFIDIVLVYALVSFLGSTIISKVLIEENQND